MKPHSRSWQGQLTTATVSLQELLEACHTNIREAAAEESGMRELWNRLAPGDPRLVGTKEEPPLAYKIARARHEQEHWREYQRHYLQRIAVEGRDTLVRIPLPKRFVGGATKGLEPDRRLPREPGEDDAEELPF